MCQLFSQVASKGGDRDLRVIGKEALHRQEPCGGGGEFAIPSKIAEGSIVMVDLSHFRPAPTPVPFKKSDILLLLYVCRSVHQLVP